VRLEFAIAQQVRLVERHKIAGVRHEGIGRYLCITRMCGNFHHLLYGLLWR
jgi:hypothetical protein